MTRQLHAAALLGRLGAAPGSPALVVLDGAVPAGTVAPYALVYLLFRRLTATEAPALTALTFDSTAYQVDAYVHSVADDARASRGVANRVESQWLSWRPVIAGRSCTPLRQIESVPANPDEGTGPLVVDSVDVYRFTSVPG